MSIDKYVKKTLVAWNYYNRNYDDTSGNTHCYVYPRYIRHANGSLEEISQEEFPSMGRIDVKLLNDLTSEDFCERVGSFVEIKINNLPYENTNATNWYTMRFNPTYGKDRSDIWIEKIRGTGFIQVIPYEEGYPLDLKTKSIQITTEKFSSKKLITNEIMIKNDDCFYGPFDYDLKEKTIVLLGRNEYQYKIGKYTEDDIKNLYSIKDENNKESITILSKNDLVFPHDKDDSVDWIEDKVLINSLGSALKDSNQFTKNQIREIKASLEDVLNQYNGIEMTETRKTRLLHLLNQVLVQDEFTTQIAYYILENKNLSNTLVEYILKDHFDTIELKSKEFQTIKERKEEQLKQVAQLEKQIEALNADKSVAKNDAIEQSQEEIDRYKKEIEELKQEQKELGKLVGEIKSTNELMVCKQNLQKEIVNFEHEKDEARKDYDRWVRSKADIEQELDQKIQEFGDQSKTIARALDSKLMDRVLRAASGEEKENNPLPEFDVNLIDNDIENKQIVEQVSTFVKDKANRDVTENEIINYLICLTQGFITTFAGEPGTGKTSLCNILAKALGLCRNDFNNRFTEISVERGWTSHKDFIGYYNPLTKSMEKSNVDIFNALEMLNSEDSDQNTPPYIFLLDEANLSPIEHYWSIFLKHCDFDSSSNKTYSLGGKNNWKIPEYLRFLATVNFDHTTEELSPRFLDRSWIITLNPNEISDDVVFDDIENYDKTISFSALKEYFSIQEHDEIDEVIRNKWTNIQGIFKSNQLQIMPRNIKMVNNYCKVACRCMDRQSPEDRFAPLDYALAQKILPTINGTGNKYEKLVGDLLDECSSLPETKRHLERMKSIAEENMGFYQFFAR